MQKLKQQLDRAETFSSYGEVKTWLKREFGVDASYKVVHEAVRYKLKCKLKRQRQKKQETGKGKNNP
jgi:putative transposase